MVSALHLTQATPDRSVTLTATVTGWCGVERCIAYRAVRHRSGNCDSGGCGIGVVGHGYGIYALVMVGAVVPCLGSDGIGPLGQRPDVQLPYVVVGRTSVRIGAIAVNEHGNRAVLPFVETSTDIGTVTRELLGGERNWIRGPVVSMTTKVTVSTRDNNAVVVSHFDDHGLRPAD